jgi:oxygen-independent coproporphyrinogen-3 oxidase
MFPNMLFSYPSTYLFRKNNEELTIENINFNNNILYIHIPFCIKVCSFCNVHKIEYKNELETKKYFDILYKEIDFFSKNIN